jgi:hypothetical protein
LRHVAWSAYRPEPKAEKGGIDVSVSTLDRLQVRYFRTAVDTTLNKKPRQGGGGEVLDVPIFRTGTFKDSMGEQHTWVLEHLHQMVFHFGHLRDAGILVNVPSRNGHKSLFGAGGEVVGYITDIRIGSEDEKGNTLLLADFDITEPDAYSKIDRGTWRSRSAEIGFYETNDETMYWPVLMGVAWVDLPAVEGLFSKNQPAERGFTPLQDEQEGAVSRNAEDHNKGGEQQTPPDPSAGNPEGQGQGAPSPGTQSSEPGDEAGAGGSGGEEQGQGNGSEGNAPEGNQAGGGQGDGTSTHSAPGGPVTHTFSINGQPTTDFAAVQQHITNLETVLDENRKQARTDFVKGLASKGVIPATMVDGMTAHAAALTDEQYEAFTTMYASASSLPLFAEHGGGSPSEPDEASQVDILRERVKLHQRSGMPEDKVKATESYKELMRLTNDKG